jgi:hypothetical protein
LRSWAPSSLLREQSTLWVARCGAQGSGRAGIDGQTLGLGGADLLGADAVAALLLEQVPTWWLGRAVVKLIDFIALPA